MRVYGKKFNDFPIEIIQKKQLYEILITTIKAGNSKIDLVASFVRIDDQYEVTKKSLEIEDMMNFPDGSEIFSSILCDVAIEDDILNSKQLKKQPKQSSLTSLTDLPF